MQRFVVTSDVIGAPKAIEISKESFEAAKKKWKELLSVLLIEERFDSLVTNFLRFEELLVARLLQFERVGYIDGNHQMLVRRDLNRVLNNVLSTARGYIDQLPQVANQVFGADDPRAKRSIEILKEQYDSHVGYRVLEAIRNHAQHSGFPIHSVSYSTHMIGKFPELIDTKCLKPLTRPELLAENTKFKPPILQELKSMGREVDLNPLLRQYVAGISRAHYYVRSEAKAHSLERGVALDSLALAYMSSSATERDILGVYAVALNGDDWQEQIPLRTGTAEYYDYLCSLNSHMDFEDKDFLIGSVREDA